MKSVSPLFDVHCHLSHKNYAIDQRSSIVHEAFLVGVEKIAVVATDKEALLGALDMQDQFGRDRIKIIAATPPHDIVNDEDALFNDVRNLAKKKRLSAIGETGLEYFYCADTKVFQKKALHRYVECALKFDLPLAIHCRDAFSDMIPIIEGYRKENRPLRGMIHCFTGTIDQAKMLLDLGWYLSFSGIVTFPKSQALQEVAKFVPLDRILLETDSPYLAPKQKRGQENKPSYLVYIAEFMALLRNMPYEAIAEATFQNAETFFDTTYAK